MGQIVVGIIILVVLLFAVSAIRADCNDKGGIYIEHQCIKGELIE